MKIITPIINTWIGDFIMTLPMLKNIEKNSNLQPILIFNKQVYKDIFDFSYLKKDRFEVLITNNVTKIKFWIDLRRQSNIIISPTVWLKPLLLWKNLFFKVYSKPLIFKNRFYTLWIKTFWIPKDHDVINNIKIIERFYQDYPQVKVETQIYQPKLKVWNIKKEKIIFIHPWFDGNTKIPRDWGVENWVNLVKKLSEIKEDYIIKIIIWPWWEEKFKDYYFDLEKKLNNVKVIYKLKFKELINELAKWEILINTDSGIWHLAWALWLRTITLFGPADERQTWVFSSNAVVIRAKWSKPCYSQGIWLSNCEDKWWLLSIEVEDILQFL